MDLIRVATYIDTIAEAIEIIEFIYNKGYETTCNIMAVSGCSELQLQNAVEAVARSPVRAVYIVDSFGALYPRQIRKLVRMVEDKIFLYGKEVGIHAHNNQQCAFANTIEAVSEGATWADATVYGMGRGAGNCHLEGLLGYLNLKKNNPDPVLRFVEDKMVPLKKSGIDWGYNSYYLLSGLKNVHPQKAISATKQKNMHLVEFNKSI